MSRGDIEYPLEFELDRKKHLRVRWADGVVSEIPLTLLRRSCPCATCRAEREALKSNPLRVVPHLVNPTDQVVVSTAELAGTYALKVRWADGHDTGIYEFRLLRELGEQARGPAPAEGSGGGV
jgi:DUF971 family protein